MWLTSDFLGDQQGEKEQVIDPKDAVTTTKGFKTQEPASLEEIKQVRSELQSETRVKTSMNGKYYVMFL